MEAQKEFLNQRLEEYEEAQTIVERHASACGSEDEKQKEIDIGAIEVDLIDVESDNESLPRLVDSSDDEAPEMEESESESDDETDDEPEEI